MADEKKVVDPKSQSSSDLPYHNAETELIAAQRAYKPSGPVGIAEITEGSEGAVDGEAE